MSQSQTVQDIQPERIEFMVDQGLALVADAYGDPSAPPVILAHGGGQTRYAWGNTAATLARHGWYALALDLRGHGESGWDPQANYRIERFAEDMAEVAGQLSQPPAVVGASLGGISSLVAQGKRSEVIFHSLTLVDITPRMERDGVQKVLTFMSSNLEQGFANLEEAADAIARYMPHRPRPKSLEGLSKNLRRCDDGRYRWHWDPNFMNARSPSEPRDATPLLEAAKRLTIPTLLVRGRMSDLVSEEAAKEFLELVPHAKFVDVEDAGHMIAGDRNDIFSQAVIEFLDSLQG